MFEELAAAAAVVKVAFAEVEGAGIADEVVVVVAAGAVVLVADVEIAVAEDDDRKCCSAVKDWASLMTRVYNAAVDCFLNEHQWVNYYLLL